MEGRIRREVVGGSLALSGAGWQSEVVLEQARSSPPSTGSPGHRLRLYPRLTRLEGQFKGLSGRLLAAGGRGWGNHHYEIDFMGLRYARLRVEEERSWLRAGIRPRGKNDPWLLRAGWAHSRLQGGGLVEFWPFTPATLDLFGLRRNLIADARATVLSLGVCREWDRAVLGAVHLQMDVDLHHARTDGRLVSWEPLVLGLGRKNVWNDRLTIAGATLLDLALKGEWAVSRTVVVEAGGAQLLPLSVSRRPRVESETPRPPGPERVPSRITAAGQRAWIALRFYGG